MEVYAGLSTEDDFEELLSFQLLHSRASESMSRRILKTWGAYKLGTDMAGLARIVYINNQAVIILY